MSAIRRILIMVAVASFATACLLFEGSPIAGNLFIKAAMALRVVLFGVSAIVVVIWYYLHDLAMNKKSSTGDNKL
jgi:hypothetical protein